MASKFCGAGTRVTEIFFREEKKYLSEILTTSCFHQLLGPTHYKFSQASKGLIFHWNVREGSLYQQVLLQRAMSHLPSEAEAERALLQRGRHSHSSLKSQHLQFYTLRPVHSKSSVASTKIN